ncbi:class I adenylate-forming enzyme family protein [Planococcus lenghuensis]|uniref:Long-chain fatty acid--CoA ligase n=1 Tax=Planococcus lenghuensis TaxID=2213202 RepID=A0A1Q2L2Y3_9BACL|nr:class I adenylate-forming enzyme family protein [Planococcus lenghuensis]AQQ54724.1 long-chain fatty acid--CoA ligase [Planococcus lenghuensis]
MKMVPANLFGREGGHVFEDRPRTIGQLLADSVKEFREKTAIVTEDGQLTYGELDTQSSAIATSLQSKCGIEKGDRVAVLIGNRYQFPLMVFACAKIGAVMVPVNVKLSSEEIDYILEHSKPKVLITEEEFMGKVKKAKKANTTIITGALQSFIIDGENTFDELLKMETEYRNVHIYEEDGAFILYTSGTTGRPKGAVLAHANVIHSVMNYKLIFKTDHQLKTLIAVPMFHVTGLVGQLLHIIYIGGTAYSMRRYQNETYIKTVVENQIDFLFNVPTIFIMMSTSEEFKNHSFAFVKKVAFGGSPIYKQTFAMLKQAFPNAELHNAYGATETTSPATLMPVSYPISKVTSVGQPVYGAFIKIMDSEARECQPGEIGELYIKGPMVIKEYWENPEANEENFTDGYWHSGDLGMMDEENYVYIRDRKKDMINRAGEKIFSIEVEDVLKEHPDVVEAAVVGEPDPVFGETVKAFVVGPKLNTHSLPVLTEHCRKSLANYKVPAKIEVLESLPRNASGKILKNQLKH